MPHPNPAVASVQKLPQFRCTFSLPRDLAMDISTIAKRLRMSQSALLAVLLTEPIGKLAKMAALLPPPDDGQPMVASETVRRLRGQSVDLLRSAVAEALAAAKEVDPGFRFDGQD